MALLALLQQDSLSVARLTSALGGAHELVPCSDWKTLWESVRLRPLDGCIVDVYLPTRAAGLRELHRLRRRFPGLALVVYADFTGRERDLFALGRLKVDGVVLAGAEECARRTRDAVTEALATSVAARVLSALTGLLQPPGLDCLRWSIENAHRKPSVADMAEALSLSPRALARRLHGAGLPTAARLLLWGRLFRAAHLLESSTTTVEQVAFSLRYSTGAALARSIRREAGCSPRELARLGGTRWLVEAFLRRDAPSRPRRAWVRPTTWAFPASYAESAG